MTKALGVWLLGEHVGTLSIDGDKLNFCYSPDWLTNDAAVPLSHSLPLRTEAFDDSHARPFFAGLLPEGPLRKLLAKQFQVSNQNDFALLDHIGGECAGAVTFLDADQTYGATDENDVEWLSEEALVAVLAELPQRPMLHGKDGLRLSLAGAQDKLPVVVDKNRIGIPRNNTPSTHIMKPAIRGVDQSVVNECFCLTLARSMKIPVARAAVGTASGIDFLLVERFDRTQRTNGKTTRLHQEDFCQALGVSPNAKYQNEGGPGFPECFQLLRTATSPNAPHVLSMLDYAIFNALVGNHDAHAKNFAILYARNGPVIAPLYDVLSTAVYPSLAEKMAMKIGSKYKLDDVLTRHWEQFADACGLSRSQTKKRVVHFAASLPAAARALASDQSGKSTAQTILKEIVSLIESRCALVMRRLKS